MNSNKHPRNIAEQLSQLRDLLIVIERTTDAPDVLYKIAIEKSQYITALVEAWRAESDPSPVEIPTEYALWAENDAHEEHPAADSPFMDDTSDLQPDDACHDAASVNAELIDSVVPMQDAEELPRTDINVEDDEDVPFVEDDIVEQPVEEAVQESNHDTIEEPAAISADDFVECDVLDECDVADTMDNVPVAECDVVVYDEQVMDDDDFDDDDDEDDFADEDDDEDDEEGDDVETLLEQEFVIDELYNRGEPFDNESITVGEMMSVRQAKELRKALSLNDRFRFRRELFGNSDVTMNDTLNLIDTMSDYNEAFEYLTHDLEWSHEEPVVQEFLQLIERHFKK